AMDIEVLYHMNRKDQMVHGFNHTYVGATLVAFISILVGRPVCQFLLNRWIPSADSRFEKWIRGSQNISRSAAISGAFLGTYSHVFLDSIMHFDLHPLMPWSKDNSLLGLISVESLHFFCIFSGLTGSIILLSWFYVTKSTRKYD
ncbi:DUF4184 family protein, partial [bacterium]|nr:DUF4184 family protein [bacterium]